MDEVFLSYSVAQPNFSVSWLKGFKSDIMRWDPCASNISKFAHANFDLMGYKNPGHCVNFMPQHRESSRKRFFWENPVPDNLTHIAGAHSLGAFLQAEHILESDENALAFVQNHDAWYIANPFLGDKYHDWRICRAFSKAWGIRHKPAGTTLVERPFSKLEEGFEDNPTHLQSDILHQETKSFMQRLREKGTLSKHLSNLPIVIITGDHDPVCNKKNIEEFAEIIGAEIVPFRSGHNPMIKLTDAQHFCVDWCQQIADRKQYALRMAANRRPSSGRFGFSLEGRAGALDAGTSLA